eukprot:m.67861 g.67861  ORF g.67861 m.67861 type:complete len:919 (+) comp11597_c0_seq3:108-2864(+)
MSMAQQYGTWEDVYDYLLGAGVIPSALEKDLVEVVNSLRDGVALCKLAQLLTEGNVQFNEEAAAQFLCMENIHIFQTFCVNVGIKEEDLFEDDDLFHAVKFENIVKTISLVSKTALSSSKGFKSFPSQESLDSSAVIVSEDMYENLSGIIENLAPSSNYGGVYGKYGKRRTHSHGEGDIFDATEVQTDDVYASIVRGRKKPRPQSDKLHHCFDELIGNEERFVGSLEVLNKAYRIPLRSFFQRNAALAIDTNPVFKFLETFRSLHARILQSLKGRNGMECEAFIRFRDELIIYADYCSNLPHAYNTVKEMEMDAVVGPALLKMTAESGQKFTLRELISVPMQHVLRYPLLLKEIVKQSKPASKTLQDASKTSQDVAKHVNESKFDAENQEYVKKVASSLRDYFTTTDDFGKPRTTLNELGRYFLDGDVKLRLRNAQKASSRYIFLFQRSLLVCKARRTGYHFYFQMSLDLFEIGTEMVKGFRIPGISLTSKAPNASGFNCVILFKSDQIRDTWIGGLQAAKELTRMETLANPTERSHDYLPHSFEDGATCTHCALLLWGKLNQGVRCNGCGAQVHRECVEMFQHDCPSKLPKTVSSFKKTTRRTGRGDVLTTGAKVGDLLVAVHSFKNHKSAQEGDLLFKKGDFVRVVAMPEKHWWVGKHEDTGKKGTFPVSFFKVVDVKGMRDGRRLSATQAPLLKLSTVSQASIAQKDYQPPKSRPKATLTLSTEGSAPPLPPKPKQETAPPILPPSRTPSNMWYMGPMDRLSAQEHLLMAQTGSFCVRESVTTPGNYVVTIKCSSSIRHLKVKSSSNGYFLGVTNKFPSIPALVEFFQSHSLAAHFPEVEYTLKFPCGIKEFPKVHVYRSLFPFKAVEASELSFGQGVLIEVFEPSEGEDWWEGRVGDKIGFLPSNFVEPMETEC